MHIINTTKENEQEIKKILEHENIEYDLYDVPEYAVFSVSKAINAEVVDQLWPLANTSGTQFDGDLIVFPRK